MQKRGQAFICVKFNIKVVVAIGFALQLDTCIQNAHLQRILFRQTTPWSLIQVMGFSPILRLGDLFYSHNSVSSQQILMGLQEILPIGLEKVHRKFE